MHEAAITTALLLLLLLMHDHVVSGRFAVPVHVRRRRARSDGSRVLLRPATLVRPAGALEDQATWLLHVLGLLLDLDPH